MILRFDLHDVLNLLVVFKGKIKVPVISELCLEGLYLSPIECRKQGHQHVVGL